MIELESKYSQSKIQPQPLKCIFCIYYKWFSTELIQRKRRALQEKKWPLYDAAALALGNFYADATQYQKALDVFVEATNVFRGKEAFRMTLGRAHRMVAEMQILLENFDEAVLHVDKFLSELEAGWKMKL